VLAVRVGLAALLLGNLAGGLAAKDLAAAQAPRHVTIIATRPAFAHPGDDVSYRLDIVTEEVSETIRIQWSDAGYLSSRLISGTGHLEFEPAMGSPGPAPAWVVQAPSATIEITLRVNQDTAGKTVTVGGYVPGTNTGEFTTNQNASTQIVEPGILLPATGGPPPESARGLTGGASLIAAGLGLLVATVGLAGIGQMLDPRTLPHS